MMMRRVLSMPLMVLAIGCATAASVAADSSLIEATVGTRMVPSPARYSVLLPASYAKGDARYPVLLWLHGGGGDAGFLKSLTPLFESAWSDGSAPEMVVVTPDADRSFYLDYRDGTQRWESFILDELLPKIETDYRIDSESRYVGGVSMGGMGALRMAFKRPELFRAVIAFEPGIEPALAWKDVTLPDKFWRNEGLLVARYGTADAGIDAAYWADNNPATLAERDPRRLIAARLAIYLEVGSEDAFGLDRGTNFLHETLYRHGVKHEYRYVLGADHVGRSLAPRFRDGLAFLSRMRRPAESDPQLEQTRRMIRAMKRRAGLPAD